MPYKKSLHNKYGRQPKRVFNPKQAKAVQNLAKKVIKTQSEWKHHTLNQTINPGGTPLIVDLTAVPQGDTDVTRDGDQLMASSLNYRLTGSLADTGGNFLRVILFQWFPDSTPITGSVLNLTTNYEMQAMYNTDQAPHFKILYDRVLDLSQEASGTVNSVFVSGKARIPRSKFQFNAGTTIGSNHIYLYTLSDSAIVAHPTLKMTTKLNFRDG